MSKKQNRAKQRAARALATSEGIKYTEALRRVGVDGRFGPRTSEVDAFLTSLGNLTPEQWQGIGPRLREGTAWSTRIHAVWGGRTWTNEVHKIPGVETLAVARQAALTAGKDATPPNYPSWRVAATAAEAIVLMDFLTDEQFEVLTEPMRLAGAVLPGSTRLPKVTVSDDDLPGMWERADFDGGDPDKRSYAQRERDVLSGVEAQPVPEPIRAQPHDEPRMETNSGFAHGDRSTCRVCGEPIKFYAHWDYIGVEAADWRDSYVLNDAWWVHDSHPADEHDAEPVDAGRDAQIRAAAAAVKVGNQIKFGPGERRWWTVRERNKRYIVATRQQPFAAKGIEQYTVIDLTGWTSTYNGVGPGVVRSSLNTLDGGWDQMMRWWLDDSDDEADVPWWTGIIDALTGGRFEISARRVMRVEHLIAR